MIGGIAPARGSTAGSTSVRIVGSGFIAGMTVKIDDAVIPATVVNDQVIQLTMPPHAAGSVDITVATSSSATLRQAYLYELLAVTSVAPAAGIPEGHNVVSIAGSGFTNETKVTFDGVQAEFARFVPGVSGGPLTDTVLRVYAPTHIAGPVDVVVINRDGRLRLPNGYTYASSETSDFNGVWTGIARERDTPIRFTVENNTLISVTCGSASHVFSPAVPVARGAFSVSEADIEMTGQIWSPIEANGRLAIPGCLSEFGWTANK